jgi:hypothetical protein
MKLILLVSALSAMLSAETYTGVITETMCGAKPHTMLKGRTDAECIRMCVKGPHNYALLDGGNVMKLSDQKTPAEYAARRVKITGAYDEKGKTLKVTSIEPLETN